MTFRVILLSAVTASAVLAGRSPDSLYIKVFQSPYLWRTDKQGMGLVADRSFTWLDDQTGPCMDPEGSYIYEVYGTTQRRHNALTCCQLHRTIVRGELMTLADGNSLDTSGRKVMELVPGENDVSRLSPGVYFVQERERRKVTRVIVQH